MISGIIVVDCEAPFGKGSPSVTDMTEFGAVDLFTLETFYGKDCSKETFEAFMRWCAVRGAIKEAERGRLTFVSDNPAYDWQWINFYFWKYFGWNPFGHTARRIGDFAAGLARDWNKSSAWKRLRVTKHKHHPVNDAMGNAEALRSLLKETNQA